MEVCVVVLGGGGGGGVDLFSTHQDGRPMLCGSFLYSVCGTISLDMQFGWGRFCWNTFLGSGSFRGIHS